MVAHTAVSTPHVQELLHQSMRVRGEDLTRLTQFREFLDLVDHAPTWNAGRTADFDLLVQSMIHMEQHVRPDTLRSLTTGAPSGGSWQQPPCSFEALVGRLIRFVAPA